MADSVQELYDELSQPFPLEYLDWRVGSVTKDKTRGMALCYVDARAVMDRLDSVCGPDGWQCNYTVMSGAVICNLGIRMGGEWIWKADGAGASDVEAEKGMLSDALKRAAVRFGVGRYLYDLDSPWVELEPGKNDRAGPMKASERKRLDELHDQQAAKAGWGGPTAVASYRFLVRIVQETVTQQSDAIAFREKYKSMFSLLRVSMRRHLEQLLDNAGSYSTKQAAE